MTEQLFDGPICETSGLSFSYPFPRNVTALFEVDLSIYPGERIAICGPSGSGKTTLMMILGLLDLPSNGSYRFNGQSVTTFSKSERNTIRSTQIGFVFQSFFLLPGRTALDNVATGLLYLESDRALRERRAFDCIEAVGLASRWNHFPNELSGGEQQRIAIARALAPKPSILLADEPTGNLDSSTSKQIISTLSALCTERNTSLVIVTHDSELASTQSRVISVVDGKTQDKSRWRDA